MPNERDPATLDAKTDNGVRGIGEKQGIVAFIMDVIQRASFAHLPAVTFCRCCCLPYCLVLRSTVWAAKAN
ncbi:hypothetical protein ACLK19_23765 [Escherichia coli]